MKGFPNILDAKGLKGLAAKLFEVVVAVVWTGVGQVDDGGFSKEWRGPSFLSLAPLPTVTFSTPFVELAKWVTVTDLSKAGECSVSASPGAANSSTRTELLLPTERVNLSPPYAGKKKTDTPSVNKAKPNK